MIISSLNNQLRSRMGGPSKFNLVRPCFGRRHASAVGVIGLKVCCCSQFVVVVTAFMSSFYWLIEFTILPIFYRELKWWPSKLSVAPLPPKVPNPKMYLLWLNIMVWKMIYHTNNIINRMERDSNSSVWKKHIHFNKYEYVYVCKTRQ